MTRASSAPDSAAWAVHGALPTFVAGIRALLLQTLHPGAMAGVHDWSLYREDALGRLSRTVRWIVVVTFSDTAAAVRESRRIDRLHERVAGSYTDAGGTARRYSARDTELLTWVHDVFTDSFLVCHQIWGGPIPGGADQYVREWATAGELVGVQSPPRSAAELHSQLDEFRRSGALTSDDRVAEAVRFIRSPGLKQSIMPAYRILFAGAVASIPAGVPHAAGPETCLVAGDHGHAADAVGHPAGAAWRLRQRAGRPQAAGPAGTLTPETEALNPVFKEIVTCGRLRTGE